MAQPYLRFPPFPTPPDGAKIIPFREFTESGIQMFSTVVDGEEEVEIDGRGVPTVQLRVKHDTDECKSNVKRKREKKKNKAREEDRDGTRPARKVDWWEQWEEAEHLRVFNYDPNLARVDRIFQAAHDFKANRTWPPAPIGVQAIWDQFRLFTGLLSNTPVWRKPADDKISGAAVDEDVYSDEDEAPTHAANDLNPKKTVPAYPECDVLAEMDEDVDEQKEEKLQAFLNDPERAIKIFLSSFMRKQGLIWSDRNLTSTPTLISFFLRFLQRNRVLPEPTHVRGLRDALAVVDLASKELPLTAKIARAVPDTFHKACVACWEERAEGYKTLGVAAVVEDKKKEEEEPDSKRRKVCKSDGTEVDVDGPGLCLGKTETEVDAEAKARFEAELKAANVQILKSGEDIVMENLDIKTGGDATGATEDNANADGGAWGGGDGWGDDGDTAAATYDPSAFTPLSATDASAWEATPYTLVTFLGPTVLPLTHATGVVELSVRRIKEVGVVGAGGGVSKGVEAELESMFAKVVLEPWLGWGSGEEVNMSKPKILESSRGAVVGVGGTTGETGGAGTAKPHDPANDDIVVLVEPGVLGTLSVGMGLGATWVQLVRQDQVQDSGVGAAKMAEKKGKGKGKGKKAAERYWYVEEVTMILPSYYTA